MSDSKKFKIQIMWPLLPELADIEPYLKKIDENRWYSNFGPLVVDLENRFAEYFGVEEGCVKTVSSGTSGLTNVLRAWHLPRGSFCVVPAWTFMATAAAACAAELTPYFVDVDSDTWALDPDYLKEQLQYIPGQVSSVIVVSPFGHPIETAKWNKFTDETGIKVLIDGAAGFDSISLLPEAAPSTTPIVISLHATKPFGVGEGGIVISTDKELILQVHEMSNFGFSERNTITVPGTNGKMSEYIAAVSHASLDRWEEKRKKWMDIIELYLEAFENMGLKSNLSRDFVSSTCNIRLEKDDADTVIQKLIDNGVESRKWWRHGCHRQPAYGEYPRLPLPVTEELARSVLALPFYIGLTKEDIDYIAATLSTILSAEDRAARENMMATYSEIREQ